MFLPLNALSVLPAATLSFGPVELGYSGGEMPEA